MEVRITHPSSAENCPKSATVMLGFVQEKGCAGLGGGGEYFWVERVVDDLNGNEGEGGVEGCRGRIGFVQAPLVEDDDCVDHVHLNRGGYAVWDRVLWPVVEECLKAEGLAAGQSLGVAEKGKELG